MVLSSNKSRKIRIPSLFIFYVLFLDYMDANVVVISGFGINSEVETAYSVKKVGGNVDIKHLNEFIEAPALLQTYNFIIFPGGFSYSDHLGAAKVFSNKVVYKLKDQLTDFINDGKLIMGICNGFQALVKIGILPHSDFQQRVALTFNDSGKFEDRWVRVRINKKSHSIFTRNIDYLEMPVRHGEGKFVPKNQEVLLNLLNNDLVAMQYVDNFGKLAGYPFNPNGSIQNIAAISNQNGNIFGIMPHPESYNHYTNHPLWTRGLSKRAEGLKIFKNAVDYLKNEF